jgi:hypothetical protein
MSNCCAVVSGMLGNPDAGTMTSGSGGANCTAMCPASATVDGSGGFTAHTKLCHVTSDCTNYSGTAPIVGNVAFDGCCSSAMTGPFTFCAPKMYAATLKLNCL